jgi:hypothetical protein
MWTCEGMGKVCIFLISQPIFRFEDVGVKQQHDTTKRRQRNYNLVTHYESTDG